MARGSTTATNGASTLIIDADNNFSTATLENLGSSTVWLAFGEAAVNNQGTSLAATGLDGSAIVLPWGLYPKQIYAWADGTNCDIAWSTVSR